MVAANLDFVVIYLKYEKILISAELLIQQKTFKQHFELICASIHTFLRFLLECGGHLGFWRLYIGATKKVR